MWQDWHSMHFPGKLDTFSAFYRTCQPKVSPPVWRSPASFSSWERDEASYKKTVSSWEWRGFGAACRGQGGRKKLKTDISWLLACVRLQTHTHTESHLCVQWRELERETQQSDKRLSATTPQRRCSLTSTQTTSKSLFFMYIISQRWHRRKELWTHLFSICGEIHHHVIRRAWLFAAASAAPA